MKNQKRLILILAAVFAAILLPAAARAQDSDGDGRTGAADCNDSNPFTWDSCATCVDADLDNWYGVCNRYSAGSITTTIGTGTSLQVFPLASGAHDARSQLIYLQSEIGGARIISSLQLDVTTVPRPVLNNFTIRMKHTAASSYSAVAWESAGWTTVYQGNVTISSTGWNTFNFSTPFDYNGTSNLMIDISFNNSTGGIYGYVHYTTVSANRALYYNTNSGYGDPLTWNGTTPPGTTSANRPNIRLVYDAGINGPDCNDSNTFTWDTCATCVEADLDNWYGVCNRYSTGTVTFGTGTGTMSYILAGTYHDARSQMIYHQSEIGEAGIISSLQLDVATTYGQVLNNFTIRMKHTTASTYPWNVVAWESAGWTTVYQGNVTFSSTGWNTFTFSTPFVYNGINNLMIDISFHNSTKTATGWVRDTFVEYNRALYYSTDSDLGDPLTWNGTTPDAVIRGELPNIRLIRTHINGPDCDEANPLHWSDCATCADNDGDSWYAACDTYSGINGPDCDDVNPVHWSDCATCVDADGDSWSGVCNTYAGINGPDCSPLDPNHWNDCGACVDADTDGRGTSCNKGTDCNDANTFTWDTCATCVDTDLDNWYAVCNRYFDTVTIGTGTGDMAYPLASSYHAARSQLIYLRSEVGGARIISSLQLDVTRIPGQVLNNFTIRMKHTAASSYSTVAWESDGWTTVYQGNVTISSTGWNSFNFSTPFDYNGIQNLMIDISFNNSSSSSYGKVRATTTTTTNRALQYSTDNSFLGDPFTWNGTIPAADIFYGNAMPNIRLAYSAGIKGPDCSDTNPNAGNTCATCVDNDSDSWYAGCNQYVTVSGPDCSDTNTNAWDTCATCVDPDADGWYGVCNTYAGINGPDCSPSDPNYWNDCCVDADGDGRGLNCSLGADCGDSNPRAWDSCATCVDADADGWWVGCNQYPDGRGPDCDDADAITLKCPPEDQDGDGVSDLMETDLGSNPADPALYPRSLGFLEPVQQVIQMNGIDKYALAWTGSEMGAAWLDHSPLGHDHLSFFLGSGSVFGVDEMETWLDNIALSWSGSEFMLGYDGDYYGYYCYEPPCLFNRFTRFSATGTVLQTLGGSGFSPNLSLQHTGTEWVAFYDDKMRRLSTGAESPLNGHRLVWTGSEYGGFKVSSGILSFQRFSPAGVTQGGSQAIAGSVSDYSPVWTGSEFAVAYGAGAIYLARLSATGVHLGADTRLTLPDVSATVGRLSWKGNDFLLFWSDNRTGSSQRYAALVSFDGSKMTSEASYQLDPGGTIYNSDSANISHFFEHGYDTIIGWDCRDDFPFMYVFADRFGFRDGDGDGLVIDEETAAGTDPGYWDSDGDQMDDGWEFNLGVPCLSPLVMDSDTADPDHDGLGNLEEYHLRSNPCIFSIDTDGDGRFDAADCDNSDPNNWVSCASCADSDFDGRWAGCDAYVTHQGPDCSDNNSHTWNTCATCVDADLDNWYAGCNRYSGSTVTVGTGTGTQIYPLATGYHDARSQLIYLQSEVGGAGIISSLQLDVTTIPGQVLNNFSIRMKHTAASSYSAVAWESAGWTTVYQGNVTISSTGWNSFTFSTPFAYNGSSNLMIDISFNNSTYTSYGYVRYTGATANRALYYRTNSGYGDPLTWNGTTPTATISANRPNIRLVSPSINGPDCDDTTATGASCHNTCSIFYLDQDGDAYGDPASAVSKCAGSTGYVSNNTDCAPTVAAVRPGQPSPEGPGALCDGLDNQCPGETGYGTIDEGCIPPDSDGDGLNDGQEILLGTDPYDSDTDNDGIPDGEEYLTCGTDPLGWDSDGDRLPDAFEVSNLSGHPVGMTLDPLAAGDGGADFDGDGIVNTDDYWNGGGSEAGVFSGSGVWVADKVGWPACGYWGEGDGDGFISPSDLAVISLAFKGSANYAMVYPPTGETQDLDADGFLSPTDRGLLWSMIKGQQITNLPSRPAFVVRVSPATGVSVWSRVGRAVTVTVAVTGTGGEPLPGVPVVFAVAASSTGGAAILGGEGADGAGRYDLTTSRGDGGRASATVVLTAPGYAIVTANVRECGTDGVGRYSPLVVIPEPEVIMIDP